MKETFIGGGRLVWKAIRNLFGRGSKGHVAVAFLGQASRKRLRLTRGSTLVVNASEESIRCGQTDPREIFYYIQKGVRVFSHPTLHAKVFVTSNAVVIGSSNVSSVSETRLSEAAILSKLPQTITAARKFVEHVSNDEIGPERAQLLIKMYRPPRTFIQGASKKAKRSYIFAVKLHTEQWSEEAEKAKKAGHPKAQRKLKDTKRFHIDEFGFSGHLVQKHFEIGDSVLQLVSESGTGTDLHPPGHVIHIEPYFYGRIASAVFFLEVPKRIKKIPLRVAKKRLGKSARKISNLKTFRKISNRDFLEGVKQLFPSPRT